LRRVWNVIMAFGSPKGPASGNSRVPPEPFGRVFCPGNPVVLRAVSARRLRGVGRDGVGIGVGQEMPAVRPVAGVRESESRR
jgi:hypothetical protein